MMSRWVFLILIMAVTGCKSTGVIPMGHGVYMIGKKDGSPGLGVSLSNKAKVYKEANTYCQKKLLVVETVNINVIPAKVGRLGSTELEFKCVFVD